MRVRAQIAAFLLAATPWATTSLAGPTAKDADRLCRSNPLYGDTLRMVVQDELRRQQGSETDEADIETTVKLVKEEGVAKCVTDLSEDPSIFRALNTLTGFAADSGWVAWSSQCGNVVGPKGSCIEAEGRAGAELRDLNADPVTQRISRICQNLLSSRKLKSAAETENRTWLSCLKSGLKTHPTSRALDECRFVSAANDTSATDTMVRCFQDKAK